MNMRTEDIDYKIIYPKEIPAMECICYKDGKQRRRERRKQERNKRE